jgi:hypothetical protein
MTMTKEVAVSVLDLVGMQPGEEPAQPSRVPISRSTLNSGGTSDFGWPSIIRSMASPAPPRPFSSGVAGATSSIRVGGGVMLPITRPSL